MNYNEAMSFVNSYSKSGKAVTDLSRAKELMKRVGNPEKQLKFVHVAGTNGKGSTVEYISNALIYSGYKTGQFTSPYITHYADRIRINGEEIDEESLCEIAEKVKNSVADAEYSQFEITMAIALLWYVREKCDIVVLEAGIGGLLDCTNVIPPPLVAVITSISLDHTAILGDTVEKIARQKAGIIKKGSAVVLADGNTPNVIRIVESTAKKYDAEFILTERCSCGQPTVTDGMSFTYKGDFFKTQMLGRAQALNASASVEVCRCLRRKGFDISEETIKRAVSSTQIKARLQLVSHEPDILVDGGHNPDGIRNLTQLLFQWHCPVYAVVGMVDSKDYEEGVAMISRHSRKIFTVDGFVSNSVPAEKLAEIAERYTSAEACISLEEAVVKAKSLALENDGVVVVCGSLYLASEYLNNCEN
ncbi:MAG: bifunctional folylpolyglutamate synthase/dihydrofolate synthase [Ruminococcus sp.]|nr:bifunctional folylpolyglutamate synthase/dihydrofolate synthase [Ruminococcus sp.]MBR6581808.1 bifunctional folylpolyglutamate synthase/dihydrofolate synthase [Ruminococcus sp.]